jgi:hypothetical protein
MNDITASIDAQVVFAPQFCAKGGSLKPRSINNRTADDLRREYETVEGRVAQLKEGGLAAGKLTLRALQERTALLRKAMVNRLVEEQLSRLSSIQDLTRLEKIWTGIELDRVDNEQGGATQDPPEALAKIQSTVEAWLLDHYGRRFERLTNSQLKAVLSEIDRDLRGTPAQSRNSDSVLARVGTERAKELLAQIYNLACDVLMNRELAFYLK